MNTSGGVSLNDITVASAIDDETNQRLVVIQFPQLGGRVVLSVPDAAKLVEAMEDAIKHISTRDIN
jgi:hypothetical protein